MSPPGFVLPVDKPTGPTSHDVVAAARRSLGVRKIGHSGTLDPFASGLLLLCVGRATRLAEYLSGLDKRYEATARLGVATDTLDLDGEVIASAEASHVEKASVVDALAAFRGEIDQRPPQFSAKKVDGVRMHERARRGERVELPPCRVTVHQIDLLAFDPPEVRFAVHCSSGTYIRAIARDLGEALGVGAHLTALRRTAIGRVEVGDAVSLPALDVADAVAAARIAPLEALAHLPRVEVDEADAARLAHGQRLEVGDEAPAGLVAVSHIGALLAVGEVVGGRLAPRKVFAT